MLDVLYYPFSRCIDASTLKHHLLLFDTITFLDPVDSDTWRAKLMRDQERASSPAFKGYRDIQRDLDRLKEEQAVIRRDPASFSTATTDDVALAAASDLLDPVWQRLASAPGRFGLPFIPGSDGKPTWQAFKPKLPPAFVTALRGDDNLAPHMFEDGGDEYSWSLSYAAGSACAMNVHLKVAGENGLLPVTDSDLHHRLLLVKSLRAQRNAQTQESCDGAALIALPDDSTLDRLAAQMASVVVRDLVPREALESSQFADIIRFRRQTRELRADFIGSVRERLMSLPGSIDAQGFLAFQRQFRATTAGEVRKYDAGMAAARDKIWTGLPDYISASPVAGSIGAVAIAATGITPLDLVWGSVLAAATALLGLSLNAKAAQTKVHRESEPGIAYLSRLKSMNPQ